MVKDSCQFARTEAPAEQCDRGIMQTRGPSLFHLWFANQLSSSVCFGVQVGAIDYLHSLSMEYLAITLCVCIVWLNCGSVSKWYRIGIGVTMVSVRR